MNRDWDNGGANICDLGVLGEECEAKKIFGKIIAENLTKQCKTQICRFEKQKKSHPEEKEKLTPRYGYFIVIVWKPKTKKAGT